MEVIRMNLSKRKIMKYAVWAFVFGVTMFAMQRNVMATTTPNIEVNFNAANGTEGLGALDILFLMVLLSVIPSMILLMTSFTRIVIVFSFLRNALGTQQSPPNQVLIGLSLFLTLFIMSPVISRINETAYKPYEAGEITQEEAIEAAKVPLKEFMLKQVDKDSLNLFVSLSKTEMPLTNGELTQNDLMKLGLDVIVPSFVTSELKRAFTMGFLIYVPFLIIDIVVSSTLMSMGMVMLPPTTIALPFKIMLFILADGWGLVMSSLVNSFH